MTLKAATVVALAVVSLVGTSWCTPVRGERLSGVAVEVNDPHRSSQWALDVLAAETAWNRQTAEGVVVAVVDTGIDASHPDLAGNVIPGTDLLNPSTAGTVDPNGHGTGVAGIIGATVGNALGMAGLAPNVTLLPVRVLDRSRIGTVEDVEAGIRYATLRDADVINLSFGSTRSFAAIREAIDDATLAGAVVVASAGNSFDSDNTPRYPAADSDVVSVTAVDRGLLQASFSTTHRTVDLTAPGVDILMTGPGSSYVRDAGTSFAAPHVSATAALIKARYPRATASQVVERLVESARDLPPSGRDDATGHGLVQPAAALEWEPDAGCQLVAFDPLMRVWDDNRVDTSAAAACTFWPEGDTRHVLLATAAAYPDALAGTPLAARLDAPLLLTHPDVLAVGLRQVLAQLGVRTVTVLGGERAVSRQVDAALGAMGIAVRRIAGVDRYDTAAKVAQHIGGVPRVVVVTGQGFADAVAAGAYTAEDAPPVLLTLPDHLPADTLTTLAALRPEEVIVVGGPKVVSAGVIERLERATNARVRRVWGSDRYATSVAVVADVDRSAAGDPNSGRTRVVLATGAAFPDALAAGAVAARLDGPLLLVRPGDAGRAAAVVSAGPWSSAALLGGTAAVSSADAAALTAALDGVAGSSAAENSGGVHVTGLGP